MRSLLRGIASLVAAMSVALVLIAPASGATDLFASLDSGFESDAGAWSPTPTDGFSLVTPPVAHSGKAGRLVATIGTASLQSRYWLTPTVPGATSTLTLWLYDNDPNIKLSTALDVLKDNGGSVATLQLPEAVLTNDLPTWRFITIGPITAPTNGAYVRVSVSGTAKANNATFYIDDISLTRVDPPPTPAPTATPTSMTSPATSTPTSAPTQLASTPTMAPTSAATPSLAPTATTIATPAPVFPTLVNGNFEALAPLDGWDNVGGTLSTVSPGLDGTGRAALLTSSTDSTKYAFETVTVEPAAWYAARGSLRPSGDASAAWLRVAWYTSTDGSGSQLAVADSNLVTTRDVTGTATLAASQAPSTARSARVRVMLRPASASAAAIVADDITFTATSAPVATPAPTPRNVPTPGTRPADSAASTQPAPAANGSNASNTSSAPAASTSRPSSAAPNANAPRVGTPAPRAAVNGPLLRITELMPDPPEPGADQDFEWIELANLGTSSTTLEGLWLADNAGAIELPPLTLAAGKVLVIAGAQAKVPDTESWSPPGGFSNGLGNAGDRLVLYTKDGGILDALSYGSDTTFDKPALPASGPGKSLVRRFADDGSFASAEVSTSPTPGQLVMFEANTTAAEERTTSAQSVAASSALAYVALGGLGVAAVGAAAAQRYRTARALKASRTDEPAS